MKNIFFIVSVLLLLTGCSNRSTHSDEYVIVGSKTVPYDVEKLSSALSHFDLIPLETNDSCLISDIDVIKKRNDKYYIQSGRKYLHVFDEAGRYIQKIGNMGEGEGEYSILSDFDVDDENIYLLAFQKLYVYDLSGKFQKKIDLEDNVRTITCVKDGFLTFINSAQGEDVLGFMDRNGKMIRTALPKNEALRLVRKTPWLEWKPNTYFFQMAQSNDLYCFDIPQKDFDKKGFVADYDNVVSFDKLMAMDEMDPTEYSSLIFDGFTGSRSQIIFGGITDGNITLYIYDKQSGKSHSVAIASVEDDVTFSECMLFVQNLGQCDSDDENLITYIETDVLKEAIEGKSGLDENIYGKLRNTEEEHNPTILTYRFK